MLVYKWTIKNTEVPVRVTIVKNEIKYVEVVDMFKVLEFFNKKYKEDFNFKNEFERDVVLVKLLSS